MPTPLEELDLETLFGPQPAAQPDPDPFGRIGAGDPAWETLRGAWMEGAPLKTLFGEQLFDLNGTVGTGQTNQRGDVFKLQSLLHREGVLDAEATGGPTGYWGNRDDAALRSLQKENGLTVDGWAGPKGETIGWLRDLYNPPQGMAIQADRSVPMPIISGKPEATSTTIRDANRDLAKTLGLDPAKIDLDSPDTMQALSAVRFYHHLNRQQKVQAMGDIERLKRDNPELAGKLRGKIADSIANPVWEIPSMTPERLQQARTETEDGLRMMQVIEGINRAGKGVWKHHKPKTAPKPIGQGMTVFGSGIKAMRQGFEKTLADIDAEEARRAAP